MHTLFYTHYLGIFLVNDETQANLSASYNNYYSLLFVSLYIMFGKKISRNILLPEIIDVIYTNHHDFPL